MEVEVFEAVNLIVSLKVADVRVLASLVHLVVNGSYRVARSKGVRTLLPVRILVVSRYRPLLEAVPVLLVEVSIVIYRLCRVVRDSITDSITVGIIRV